jgi:hypothetical protein
MMGAILETSPGFAEEFLPRKRVRSPASCMRVFASGTAAVVRTLLARAAPRRRVAGRTRVADVLVVGRDPGGVVNASAPLRRGGPTASPCSTSDNQDRH